MHGIKCIWIKSIGCYCRKVTMLKLPRNLLVDEFCIYSNFIHFGITTESYYRRITLGRGKVASGGGVGCVWVVKTMVGFCSHIKTFSRIYFGEGMMAVLFFHFFSLIFFCQFSLRYHHHPHPAIVSASICVNFHTV